MIKTRAVRRRSPCFIVFLTNCKEMITGIDCTVTVRCIMLWNERIHYMG